MSADAYIIDPAPQYRRTVSYGARNYYDKVTSISCLLASSAAALADNDYVAAEQDRRQAFALMGKLSDLIDETEREVCLPTDGCDECGSPSMHRCECED